MPAVIRCLKLVKTYEGRPPVEAVRGLDLEVEQGECFGLLGPNGAGTGSIRRFVSQADEARQSMRDYLGKFYSYDN